MLGREQGTEHWVRREQGDPYKAAAAVQVMMVACTRAGEGEVVPYWSQQDSDGIQMPGVP